MNSDFKELLKLFNDNEVKYLTGHGGYAVMLYTEPRYTEDLDVWIEASEENAARVFRALAEFGAPLAGAHAGRFRCIGLLLSTWQAASAGRDLDVD